MKKRFFTNLLAVVLCAALLFSCLSVAACAETADTDVQMVEGDVVEGFVPAGTECTSSDPSVAWVDDSGSLNAMKIGTAMISDGTTDYTVTVSDYEDGSEVIGSLKILARYNDSMQFYDGHVYLLFTCYQDGVTVTVPDPYAAYEISDQYYEDIAEDISVGSNHTGSDAYQYFNECYEVDSMTLNRGEIVTIGMYRGFDLSVVQAALGAITNSTAWSDLVAAGKASAVLAIFDYLYLGKISPDDALDRLNDVLADTGSDYAKVLDGVVDGGVCFNRELYNQKLEWDQYENVTYELDITRDQFDALMQSLGGNNGKFSILKNSCATVALRAWNAAVGTRDGERTSYYLSTTGEGIFSIIDAPKTVRDSIVDRLPGYYLNNADGIAEPDAGYQDETGWVYVSAPEYVTPLVTIYDDTTITLDAVASDISDLITAAKGDQSISYHKDDQVINVSIDYEIDGEWTTISGVDITVNGTTLSIDNVNMPEDGVNFTVPYDEPAEGEYYYLLGQNDEEISGYYSEGYLCIHADSFPITYQVASAPYEDEPSGIGINVGGFFDDDISPEVYYKNGDDVIFIEESAYIDAGTKVYIKPAIPDYDSAHILEDIIFGEDSILDSTHFDDEENAYFVILPEEFSYLTISYAEADISVTGEKFVQISVGDTVDLSQHVQLKTVYDTESDKVLFETVYEQNEGSAVIDGKSLTANQSGTVFVRAYSEDNKNINVMLYLELCEGLEEMCAITMNDYDTQDYRITVTYDDIDQIFPVYFSGYRVKKGAKLVVQPTQSDSKVMRSVTCNGKTLKARESYTVNGDTEVKVQFAEAQIKGLPKTVTLASQDDTYQLEAQVKYTGLMQFLPVYDSSVTYFSYDSLIEVSDDGLITVVDEIPEEGCVAYVTAYAGSSNNQVSAVCKVVLGDYQGEKIVGSLTISARPIVKAQLVSHAMITYTAYEDTDLDVSYYEYYKPNEKFYALMQDYTEHPEDYSSDPVLYSDNELGIKDRASYFDISYAGAFSEPQTIQLGAGESITISNYGIESNSLYFILKAFENSSLSAVSPQVQEFVAFMNLYMEGEDIDAPSAFDDMIATVAQMISYTKMTGYNPADGIGDGGLMINREAYNQFRRADSQTPNHYYTVDITADELAMLENYLADPQNNYYSLIAKSCATGTVDLWNATLADRPELQIKGNYTGLANDPMSIYYEIGFMRYNSDLDGEGGDDFYPRIVVCEKSDKSDDPDNPDDPDDPDDPIDPAEQDPVELGKWYVLGDADGDSEITILDATAIQRYLAGIVDEEYIDLDAAAVTGEALTILDATYIQRYLAGIGADEYPIAKVFNRAAGTPAETIEETVIADTNGVKVTAKSLGRDHIPYLNLTIENANDKDITVFFAPITVNGFQVPVDFKFETEDGDSYETTATVPAGTTVDVVLVFDGGIMDEDHLSVITRIGFTTCLEDPDTCQVIASQKATINTSAYGSFDDAYDESGETVYDNNGIKLIYKGLSLDGMNTPIFYIRNESGKDIVINAEEMKMNGEEIEGVLGAEVFSGCRSINMLGYFTETKPGDSIEVIFEICERTDDHMNEPVLYTADAFSFTL